MAKELAFSIKILGTDTEIKNIEQLKGALKSVNDALSKADFNSDEYRELSNQAGVLTSQLNKLTTEAKTQQQMWNSIAYPVKSFKDLKLETASLTEQLQSNARGVSITNEEYDKLKTKILENKKLMAEQSAELSLSKNNLKDVADLIKLGIDAKNFENNSIKENRELLKTLNAEYVNLKSPTADQTAEIKKLTDTLKAQESAIGDNRRNVGAYSEGLKAAFKELSIGGVQLGTVTEGLKGATSGFQAAGGGVKGFSVALATTGLPLIIMGINGLIEVFRAFKPVSDAVESSVTALKAAFNGLISGNGIGQAVKDSLELLNVMRDLEDTQNAFSINVERERNEIQRLIVASKDRTKTEEERLALISKANSIEKAGFDAGVNRIDKEIAAREKKMKNELKFNDAEIKILTEGTSAQALALRERAEKNKAYNEEDLKILQDKIRERAQMEGQSLVLQEKLQARTNQLLEKSQEEREKNIAKEQERLNKLAEKRSQYNDKVAALLNEFSLSEREKLEKSFTDKIKLINGDNAQELALIELINTKKKEALGKFDEDARKKREDERKKYVAEIIAIQSEDFSRQIELNKQALDLELEAVDLSVGSEKDKADRKREIQIKYLQDQIELARQLMDVDGERTQEELNNIQKLENAISRLKQTKEASSDNATFASSIGVDQESIDAITGGLQTVSNAVQGIQDVINSAFQIRMNNIDAATNAEIKAVQRSGESEEKKQKKIEAIEKEAARKKDEIAKEQFETNKALNIVNAIIAGALGVVNAFQLGPIAGAIAAVAIAATTAAQIGVIASQQYPSKLALGGDIDGDINNVRGGTIPSDAGVIQGPSHAGGGVDFVYKGKKFNAEGGELKTNNGKKRYIFTKGVNNDPVLRRIALATHNNEGHPMAQIVGSIINQAAGGRSFGNGNYRNIMAAGGDVDGMISNTLTPTIVVSQMSDPAILQLIAEVNNNNVLLRERVEKLQSRQDNMKIVLPVDRVTDLQRQEEETRTAGFI